MGNLKKNEQLIEYKKKKVFSDSISSFSVRKADELKEIIKDKSKSEFDLVTPLKSSNYTLDFSLINYFDDNYFKDTVKIINPKSKKEEESIIFDLLAIKKAHKDLNIIKDI